MSENKSVVEVLIEHMPKNQFMPIYQRVYDAVTVCIDKGLLLPGQLLPSVRELTDLLQVSTMTISKAYQLLKRDGIVEADTAGRGTRIAERKGIDDLVGRLVDSAKASNLELKDLLAIVKKRYSS